MTAIALPLLVLALPLTGTVRDDDSSVPLSGASVRIPWSGSVTITDRQGRFFIDVEERRTDVVIAAPGYETLRLLDVTLDPAGTDLDVRLRSGHSESSQPLYQVGEIAVTASRTEALVSETPREVRVIDRSEILERQAQGTPEALNDAPEVHVQKTNLGGGSPIIRGLSGNRVLLMVDGVRLNNSTYRTGLNQYLNTIDPGIVDRIEVVPGAGSVLYGTDALGGVVQVLTVEPMGQPDIAYDGQITAAEGSHTHALRVSREWEGGGVLLSGGYRDFEDVRGGDDIGVQRPTGYTDRSAAARVEHAWSETSRLQAGYQFTRQSDVPRTDRIVAGQDSVYRYDPQHRELAFLRYEGRRPSEGIETLRVTTSWNHQREGRTIIGADSDVRERFMDDVQTYGLSLELRSLSGARTLLVYGADLYHDVVDSRGSETSLTDASKSFTEGKFPKDGRNTTGGFFARATRSLNARWNVIGSLRLGFFRLSGTPQGPSGRVVSTNRTLTGAFETRFKLGEGDYVFTGVSQGFRSPSMEDALSTGLSNKGYDVPNPALEPEHTLNVEVGVKSIGFVDADDWRSNTRKSYRAQLTGFFTLVRDLIEREPTTFLGADSLDGAAVFHQANLGKARLFGASARGALEFHEHWLARAAITYTYGENTDLDVPLTRIPPLTITASLRHDSGPLWVEGVLRAAATQSRLSPDDGRDSRIPPGGTPGYAVADVGVGVVAGQGWRVGLRVENLLDEAHRVHGSGIDMPGRNATLGVSFSANPFSKDAP